jgi:hypothetical protein
MHLLYTTTQEYQKINIHRTVYTYKYASTKLYTELTSETNCEIWTVSHSGVAENSSLLGCDVVSLGEWFMTFKGIYCLQNVRNHSAVERASHPKRSKSSANKLFPINACEYRSTCYMNVSF